MTASHAIRSFLRDDYGPALHSMARNVGACLVLAYVAGFAFGTALHRLNDQLSQLISQNQSAAQVISSAAIAPKAIQASSIMTGPPGLLTVKRLRKMAQDAGLPRSLYASGRKADLMDALGFA